MRRPRSSHMSQGKPGAVNLSRRVVGAVQLLLDHMAPILRQLQADAVPWQQPRARTDRGLIELLPRAD